MEHENVSSSRRSVVRVGALGALAGLGMAATAAPAQAKNPHQYPYFGTGKDSVLNVKELGAVGDGVTDDSAAFARAMQIAKANILATMPHGIEADPRGTVSIYLPPGRYLITQPEVFLNDTGVTRHVGGLRYFGEGYAVSQVIFKPAKSAALAKNDMWMFMEFDSLGFYAATPGCTFMQSYTWHNAQRYAFRNCMFNRFKYVIDLKGDNNNSELHFTNCHNGLMEDGGAFLYVAPGDQTSDQFLNYWFYGCTHWLTSAPFIDMAKGGHVHIFGLDASAFCKDRANDAEPRFLFYLRGNNHSEGVNSFYGEGVRVESFSDTAGVLFSEWPMGNVTFVNLDMSSQVWAAHNYQTMFHLDIDALAGASYVIENSHIAGGVNVKYNPVQTWTDRHRIVFRDCMWRQRLSPSDAVTYQVPAGYDPEVDVVPAVHFEGCRSVDETTRRPEQPHGVATWDATIGWHHDYVNNLTARRLSLRALKGVPVDGDAVLRYRLPRGAMITALELLSPAGGAVTDGSTWQVRTSSGEVVGALTAAGSADGQITRVDLTAPYLCRTNEQALLEVRASNVGVHDGRSVLIVHGYW